MNVMTEPSLHDVIAVAQEVWSSFLGETEPLLEGLPLGDDIPVISATVTVSGGWAGTISLHVPRDLAHTFTAAMLGGGSGFDDSGFDDSDVSDAIGELVNVVGGQVKSLMPGPSVLSLPVVAHGRVLWPHETAEVLSADLCWAGRPLCIAVHVPVD